MHRLVGPYVGVGPEVRVGPYVGVGPYVVVGSDVLDLRYVRPHGAGPHGGVVVRYPPDLGVPVRNL